MSGQNAFDVPIVTDDDVAWVCKLLRLPATAFSGSDGSDPRLAILKSNETLDVEASPGSGKTTLLVAKLAILARKWPATSRGICVLSHTNVARREIEERIGNTATSSRLLSYPHFVGTIHGFVNQFLAIPWLRSKGFAVKMVDDRVATARRWKALPFGTRQALEAAGRDADLLRITAPDFSIGDVPWGKKKTPLGRSTQTYLNIQSACKKACEEGFFCYDEMFLWAHELMSRMPEIRAAIRRRFPLVFIDEVQDNSELQSVLLFRLFTEGENPATRQRFGDANQAIYQHAGSTEGASTDTFPQPLIRKDIPNSYRFGQDIANLANPLAAEPQGLVGLGPLKRTVKANSEGQSAVFLFEDNTIGSVLNNYARHLVNTFSESDLQQGIFTAVGAIHRPAQADKQPRSLCHYCESYDHELTAVESKPSTFYQYVMAGRRAARLVGEAYPLVERVAEGILRLVTMSSVIADPVVGGRKHRQVLRLLREDPAAARSYRKLITALAIDERDVPISEVGERWSAAVRDIAAAAGSSFVESDDANAFLQVGTEEDGDQSSLRARARENVFEFPSDSPNVRVRLGSIHSVKGETHTATLVLDTFYIKHHLSVLKPWLCGHRSGAGGGAGKQLVSRLKQHYVAMTRPSHMLCLAMREDGIEPVEIEQLKGRGWRVARVTAAAPMWL